MRKKASEIKVYVCGEFQMIPYAVIDAIMLEGRKKTDECRSCFLEDSFITFSDQKKQTPLEVYAPLAPFVSSRFRFEYINNVNNSGRLQGCLEIKKKQSQTARGAT